MFPYVAGFANSLMNGVTAAFVVYLAPKMRAKSVHIEQHFKVFFIFVCWYFNSAIFILWNKGFDGYYRTYIPFNFTSQWLAFWGPFFSTSLVFSNLLPYVPIFWRIIWLRGVCCCKRKESRLFRRTNPEYDVELRYGQMLSTIFLVMTFGYCLPFLPFLASIVFFTQYVLDRLLATHYFHERVLYNDLLNRSVMGVTKYAVIVFFLSGAYCMA